MRDPIISTPGVTEGRKAARILLDCDPMAPSKREADGSVQVGDGWAPEAFDYANNGFKGAVAAAEDVFDAEAMKPAMIIDGAKLTEHRQDAKDVAGR